MVQETTLSRLQKIVTHQFGPDTKVDLETRFDQLDMDSLDVMELVMLLEEEFSMAFDDEELVNLTTIGELASLIDQRSETRGKS